MPPSYGVSFLRYVISILSSTSNLYFMSLQTALVPYTLFFLLLLLLFRLFGSDWRTLIFQHIVWATRAYKYRRFRKTKVRQQKKYMRKHTHGIGIHCICMVGKFVHGIHVQESHKFAQNAEHVNVNDIYFEWELFYAYANIFGLPVCNDTAKKRQLITTRQTVRRIQDEWAKETSFDLPRSIKKKKRQKKTSRAKKYANTTNPNEIEW